MNTTRTQTAEVTLLAQADALMLLADAFRAAGAVEGGDDWHDLLTAAGWAGDVELVAAWDRLRDAVEQADPHDWSLEHHRLFEGATACPLNQTAYVRRDKGAILGDLCGFYRAFNLTPTHDSGEKPDHVVTELEFLSLLLVMRAQAVRGGQDPAQAVTADAARAFARDHLCDWLAMLAAQLRLTAAMPLYHALADVLEQTWPALAQPHDWPGLAPAEAGGLPDADPQAECLDALECATSGPAARSAVTINGATPGLPQG